VSVSTRSQYVSGLAPRLGRRRTKTTRASCRRPYEDIDLLEHEDGWVALFRGNDAIRRVQESHMQEIEQVSP